jgi:hypothetical protein
MQVLEHQAELARVSQKVKGLYDAIADALRTPGLKDQLLELERRQTELKELIAQAPATGAAPASKAFGNLPSHRG